MWTTRGAWAFTISYGLIRLYWAVGGRLGYTACSQTRTYSLAEYRSGCSASHLTSLPVKEGWVAVAMCVLCGVVLALVTRRPGRVVAIGVGTASLILIALAFPGHLLFEIPAALAGRPSDWRNLGDRSLLLIGGLCYAAVAARSGGLFAGSGSAHADRPIPGWMRGCAYGACAAPILGFTLPHALWFLGVPVGIPASTLREARENITLGIALALTLVPAIGGLLSVGLAHRWGQIFPRWVPLLAGRQVPPLLALIPAGVAAVALTSYGLIGVWLMGHAVLTGTTTWMELARGWAVTGTELIFLVWGVCLSVASAGYYLVTKPTTQQAF